MTPLAGLCAWLKDSLSADLVLVLEAGTSGQGAVLAPAALQHLRGIPLGFTAQGGRLPTALLLALGGAPGHLLWQPAGEGSGLLALWRAAPAVLPAPDYLAALAPALAALIVEGRRAREAEDCRIRFAHLFETVPSGLLLIDGEGRQGFVNAPAARWLGCSPGPQAAGAISAAMGALRATCDNAAELTAAYAAHFADPDFSLTLPWHLPGLTLEVDTHPLRGDGRHGRLWMLSDVTAETLMAAHLKRLAALDPLTGIPNRRHFEERSVQILAAREASGSEIGILMLDIDHFKSINDRYGHVVGDAVLRAVACRCRDALRDRDLFARFGGEEFVGLISLSAGEDLALYAETLRQVVSSGPVDIDGLEIAVTVSIGGAQGETQGHLSVGHLLARADAALYRAKEAGRNRVEITA